MKKWVLLIVFTVFFTGLSYADVKSVAADANAKDQNTEEEAEESEPVKQLYRVEDEDGNVIFTDIAPKNQDRLDVKAIEEQPALNVLGDESKSLQNYQQKLERQIDYRLKLREEKKRRIQQAEERLQKAEQAVVDGKDPKASEWQGKAGGGRFLKQSYYQRQEQLKESVEKAREALGQAKRSR